jgi:hypothetical protein
MHGLKTNGRQGLRSVDVRPMAAPFRSLPYRPPGCRTENPRDLSLTEYIKIKKMHFIISERDSASRFLLTEVR